uniref:Uncharacterized protein n=1 Tax=Arundo donax TaxID=35708 RepID=A0A0A9D8D1_ARUDO
MHRLWAASSELDIHILCILLLILSHFPLPFCNKSVFTLMVLP